MTPAEEPESKSDLILRSLPPVRVKRGPARASRRMDAPHGLAAILRDAAKKEAAPQDEGRLSLNHHAVVADQPDVLNCVDVNDP